MFTCNLFRTIWMRPSTQLQKPSFTVDSAIQLMVCPYLPAALARSSCNWLRRWSMDFGWNPCPKIDFIHNGKSFAEAIGMLGWNLRQDWLLDLLKITQSGEQFEDLRLALDSVGRLLRCGWHCLQTPSPSSGPLRPTSKTSSVVHNFKTFATGNWVEKL